MSKSDNKFIIDRVKKKLPNSVIESVRFDQNSINGVLTDKSGKKFFKISSIESINRERMGQLKYSKFNQCPKVLGTYRLDEENSVILLEYIEAVANYENSLYFILENEEDNEEICKRILNNYFQTFDAKQIYYSDDDMIDNYQYNKFFYQRINRLEMISTEDLLFKSIIDETLFYISNIELESMRFLTHGDPSDMNFNTFEIFIDFEEADYNDIFLEFVILFWNFFIGGSYLFPKYNRTKYNNKTFSNYSGITNNRKCVLVYCISKMKEICSINKISNNKKIRYCLIFRILSVLPYDKLDKDDKKMIADLVKLVNSLNWECDEVIWDNLSRLVSGELL